MSEKITFKELVELIANQSKQSESSANSFIHELVQIIESGLKQSGSVSISGFGKFELRWMKERAGVNPQTGDEMTIPGQNKVVFKPFKALREHVNKPFANLEPEVLSEGKDSESKKSTQTDETEEADDDPFDLNSIFAPDEPLDADSPTEEDETERSDIFSTDSPFEPSPSQKQGQSVDDLIIERDNPHFGKKQTELLEEDDGDVLVLEKEENQPEQKSKIAPLLQDESKMAGEVQKSGNFKWSYAAAVIIVMVALILLFIMMQQTGENPEETAAGENQTEQVVESSAADETSQDETAAEDPQPAVDEESPPETTGDPPPQNELETESLTVQNGQSLWDIAESELENPYLWPAIYQLNQNIIENPNQLLANADVEIPTFSDPDNLTESEREQVALGYFSLYQWNRENNPDEARYFLWAVGVFSQDLLDQPPSQVDSEDLAFARNR